MVFKDYFRFRTFITTIESYDKKLSTFQLIYGRFLFIFSDNNYRIFQSFHKKENNTPLGSIVDIMS